jgi:ribonuclease PH
MNEELGIIEAQGTAESGTFSRHQLNQLIDLAEKGIQELLSAQRHSLS